MTKPMKIKRASTQPDQEIEDAFPDVDPGFKPYGSRILVQLRTPKQMSRMIILTDEAKEIEKWNTQIAKVRALGPVAFKNRTTLQPWPEGDWFKVGDYIRIPKWNQDKWEVEIEEKNALGIAVKKSVLFMLINDLDTLAEKTGNPLEVKAYI